MDATGATIASEAGGTAAAAVDEQLTRDRLAEFVVHLTDCAPTLAMAAVAEAIGDNLPQTDDERLRVIARAMLSVKQGVDLRA